MTRPRRLILVPTVAFAAMAASLLGAQDASAHVTVSSAKAVQGGYATITFKVPTESDTDSTTKLAVTIPTDHPITSVRLQPKPGWSYQIKKTALAPPIKTEDGEITEAVSEIQWTAASAASVIKPGEFDTFNVSVGPLPNVDSMTFPTLQTYSDGKVVKWIEVAAAGSSSEPEHPAPTLTLSKAESGPAAVTSSAAADDGGAKASTAAATTGIVLGSVGVGLGAIALFVTVRRRNPTI